MTKAIFSFFKELFLFVTVVFRFTIFIFIVTTIIGFGFEIGGILAHTVAEQIQLLE